MKNNVLLYYQNRESVAYFTHDLYHLQVKMVGMISKSVLKSAFFLWKSAEFRIELNFVMKSQFLG